MKFGFLLIILYATVWGQVVVNSAGIVQTGLPPAQDNLLGPLIPSGNSPWIFGDLAEKAVADNMAPAALAAAPTLGTALQGTVSFSGGNTLNTTADLRGALSGKAWVAVAWNSVDGAGTGRLLCPISSVTASTIVCYENFAEPKFSGMTAYLLPPPDSHGCDFQCWTTENPNTVWNYYDVAIGLYRLYYRTGNPTYLTQARAYADIQWQWVIDHGYRTVSPRAGSMISQFFRAGEGHAERLPGLYNLISLWAPAWETNTDLRESGYWYWSAALGAKVDTDPTRHAQYCSWLTAYAPHWISTQNADGSWSEDEYQLNASYVSAPKSFTSPFQYGSAPWRQAINVKAMEAAYESLIDTTPQGCNNPTLAASTLTSITNAVTWQYTYGRDTTNRGVFYEVNSQSNDQMSAAGTGTVSVKVGSTSLVGAGTNWQTAGNCDGTHFIGIQGGSPRGVYKIASCASDTAATLTTAFGLYGESSNVSGSPIAFSPSASSSCGGSLAKYCYTGAGKGDRNLTRTVCGGMGWLYAQTFNATFKAWADECVSATLGGPAAGLTKAANIGVMSLPCAGPGCDGFVSDTLAAAPDCNTQAEPCVWGTFLYGNLGKNFGETFGAPGIDNVLAWRLATSNASPCDINGDGAVNVLDVQLMVSQALGTAPCTTKLDGGATCDVIDVQRVVNAALGGACRLGP